MVDRPAQPSGAVVCPNCGDERAGAYCASCGQSDRNYMRSLRPMLGDFFADTFEVDSRIFRTLKLLFFKPGQLSIEFAGNRRARYLSPIRLFLFMCFVHLGLLALFISTGWLDRAASTPTDWFGYEEPTPEQIEAVRSQLGPEQRAQLDDIMGRGPDDMNRRTMANYIALDSSVTGGSSPAVYRVLIGYYYDPVAVIERTARHTTLVVILSLPLYALILSIVYFSERRFFVEHLVLVIHLQSFSLVALLAHYLIMPRSLPTTVMSVGIAAGHVWYYLMALRRYFGESWGRTVGRWLVFAFFSFFVTLAGAIAAYLLGGP
ncbi:MAG: DUF3667 domain-containing protein [Gemmatimonadetes bacterium]|nr:DUF3667 domain-containing protein [Gemmatimonadota bacterium]MCY3679011.1 DUF3667 domain-containing protein [Gemmatimonadota bacterium]MYA40888.1 DUF3667 domain-containing protein [Gemmatimonadota bacterium]MYE91943.1 DUF3667 domain-containing protein [Gemmatimonadota bacterium]MYJ11631.1 DUF3667 domain-containing protein [Gemmatimonadota bacterium]